MSQHPDFVSEFDVNNLIEQAQKNPFGLPSDETAVQSQIAENTRSAEEVKAAFQAMQQAQQPTTFDKIGDVALAVAAIADLTTGDKRKRGQAGAKFRSLRAGRAERKQTKRDQQFQKFIQKMKLREFTGDIANRNLGLALGLNERERQIAKAHLDAIRQAHRDKVSDEQFEKKLELETKKIDALIDKGKKSAIQTAQEVREKAYEKAVKRIGTYQQALDSGLLGEAQSGPDALRAYSLLLDRTADEILAAEFGITIPQPGFGGEQANPADFLPALEQGSASLGPGLLLPKGSSPNLIDLPPSPLEERRAAISPFLVPQR